MYPVALSCENYKSFHARETIEIKPLTILIGRNSSGKSVISRLPLLMSRALSGNATSPLDLAFDGIDFGDSTLDLIHNRLPHGAVSLAIGFAENGHTTDIAATVQHFDEYKLQQIAEFRASRPDLPPLSLVWDGRDPTKSSDMYHFADTLERVRVSYRGLMPYAIEPLNGTAASAQLQSWQAALHIVRAKVAESLSSITYLGPFRKAPERHYRYAPGTIRGVGFAGASAAALLGEDHLRHGGEILGAVGKWFEKHLGGWRLAILEQGELFSLVLSPAGNPSVKVNLVDVGTGIAQVLPIVVQRHFDMSSRRHGGLEIVEQPELHLHPAAHGDLADLYIDTMKHCHVHFIVETHSENFILRVRRRVAELKLDPDRIRIYWVKDDLAAEPKIMPIKVLANGEVDNWPRGVFSEDFDEVKTIRMAQQGSER